MRSNQAKTGINADFLDFLGDIRTVFSTFATAFPVLSREYASRIWLTI